MKGIVNEEVFCPRLITGVDPKEKGGVSGILCVVETDPVEGRKSQFERVHADVEVHVTFVLALVEVESGGIAVGLSEADGEAGKQEQGCYEEFFHHVFTILIS